MNRRSSACRNKHGKSSKIKRKITIGIVLPAVIAVVITFSLLISFCSVLPSAADSKVEDYKKAAELAGCTWQELLVYDTIRLENELEDVNPYLSAVDFLKNMHYEVYEYIKTETGGYWKLKDSGDISNAKEICGWFGLPEDADIRDIISASRKYREPECIIQFTPKELDDLVIEKEFNEEQIEWVDVLMTSGAMDQLFGDIHELPDYVDISGTGFFGWPTPELHKITSKFAAARKHPVLGITRAHNGVDISGAGAMGSPVCAISDGVVISVNLNGGERGINIRVQHNIGDDVWISRYQHLSQANATVGQQVTKGTVIGAVGNSGIGTGPHLHLELTYNGVLIDPLPLIK